MIRTGFGITVDPLPLARPLRGFYPLTVGSNFRRSKRLVRGSIIFTPLLRPFPVVLFPSASRRFAALTSAAVSFPCRPQALERSVGPGLLKRGYIESWNLIVERRLPANFVVSVGYVGTQTVHQFADTNVNASLPAPVPWAAPELSDP